MNRLALVKLLYFSGRFELTIVYGPPGASASPICTSPNVVLGFDQSHHITNFFVFGLYSKLGCQYSPMARVAFGTASSVSTLQPVLLSVADE